MIILTTPKIKDFIKPVKVSSTVQYAFADYILAEVPDDFDLSEDEMKEFGIDFWYKLDVGLIDPEPWDIEDTYYGGVPELIYRTYNLSKEVNIAYAIQGAADHHGLSPFEIWEKAIRNPNDKYSISFDCAHLSTEEMTKFTEMWLELSQTKGIKIVNVN